MIIADMRYAAYPAEAIRSKNGHFKNRVFTLFFFFLFVAVCSYTYRTSPGIIRVQARLHTPRCQYFLQAPDNHYIILNVTRLVGLGLVHGAIVGAAQERGRTDASSAPSSSSTCAHGVEIVEIYAYTGREARLAKFCPAARANATARAPYVFHSETGLLKLTVFTLAPPSGADASPAGSATSATSAASATSATSATSGTAGRATFAAGFTLHYQFKDSEYIYFSL